MVTPAMLGAHYRLGQHRPHGESCVAVYPADDPAGFGPALQVVTDHGGMLMDSVTVLLHRLGRLLHGHHDSGVRGASQPDGGVCSASTRKRPAPRHYVGEAWIHIQLLPSVDGKALAEVERVLPKVLADVQQVAVDAAAIDRHPERPGRECRSQHRRPLLGARPRGRRGTAALAGQRQFPVAGLPALPGARWSGLRRRVERSRRHAQSPGSRPRLTDDDKLLVLAQATVGSYLRYGAYPYAIAIREYVDGGVIEHRFVGLFTVAAMNADVLEIPIDLAPGPRGAGDGRQRPRATRHSCCST